MAFLPRLTAGEFLKKIARRYSDNAVSDRAAQLSYYFLFALFPFLFFLVTLIAYLPVSGAMDELLARVEPLMPDEAFGIIHQQLAKLTSNQRPHLLGFGLVLAVWSASRGVDALRTALNLSYDVKESRPWWKTQVMAVGVTVCTSVLMLLAIAGLAISGNAGVWIANKLHLGSVWPFVWSLLRWPLTTLGVMLVAALLYYFLPDVEQEFRFITPGSVIGTGLWLLASFGFTQYADHFGSYDKTYGSIGGVIVLMTWLWVTGLIFVLGGEINALLEHASPEGKARGARKSGEAPPPPVERPSIAAPGAAKSAEAAERSQDRLH